ncbi:MAG: radical SAM protein [bacterium]|nr:radical SAM protein [bacterium]
MKLETRNLRFVAWETTRRCNLSCLHCRAGAVDKPYDGELSTSEALTMIDQIREVGQPTLILTGGEPLLREDIFDLAAYGIEKGLKVVMSPNGLLLTREVAKKLVEIGIPRISISLDGPDAESHDRLRGVPGAFEGVLAGIRAAKSEGLAFQINTTVTRQNCDRIENVMNLAVELGAAACHAFFLVPTGRGEGLKGEELTGQEYEDILIRFYEEGKRVPIPTRAICAPHYFRIIRQRGGKIQGGHSGRQEPAFLEKPGSSQGTHPGGLSTLYRGCLAATSFCFISHRGIVSPCGYLEIECGDIREKTFKEIWEGSTIFNELRNLAGYKGKCGRCKYLAVCGGCRARAYTETGDYLEEEPNCIYEELTINN